MNIINFLNVDKPRRGGRTMWIRFFVEFRHFLVLFFGHFYTYLVVFCLYLAIIREKVEKKNK